MMIVALLFLALPGIHAKGVIQPEQAASVMPFPPWALLAPALQNLGRTSGSRLDTDVFEATLQSFIRSQMEELSTLAQVTQKEVAVMQHEFTTFMCSNQSLQFVVDIRSALDEAAKAPVKANLTRDFDFVAHVSHNDKEIPSELVLLHLKQGIMQLFKSLPLAVNQFLGQRSATVLSKLNTTAVSVTDDLLVMISDLHRQQLPPVRSLLTHSHDAVQQITSLADDITGVPVWDGMLQQSLNQLQADSDEVLAEVANVTNEDLVTAAHILMDQQPGNKVDAFQTFCRAWLNVNRKLTSEMIQSTSISSGKWRHNLTGLGNFVTEQVQIGNAEVYDEFMNDTLSDPTFKAEASAVLGAAGTDILINALGRIAQDLQHAMSDLISHVNHHTVTFINGAMSSLLSDLSDHPSGDLFEKSVALSTALHDELTAALKTPATQGVSYKEVVTKIQQVLLARQAKISTETHAAMEQAITEFVHAFRADAFTIVNSVVDDAITLVRKDLIKKGMCPVDAAVAVN